MKRQTFSKELLQIDQQTEGHRKIKKKEGKLGKKNHGFECMFHLSCN